MQSKRRRRLRCARDQSRTDVEASAGMTMEQDTVVGSKILAGTLNGGRERIPMNRLRRMLRACGQYGVEIVHFKISIHLHEGKPACKDAVEIRPAVDGEGRVAGPVGRLDQR